jgi:hypothetical protein
LLRLRDLKVQRGEALKKRTPQLKFGLGCGVGRRKVLVVSNEFILPFQGFRYDSSGVAGRLLPRSPATGAPQRVANECIEPDKEVS